jgi:hypothetical protein
MYVDALMFLEDEREAWRPFEALATLGDRMLDRTEDSRAPTEATHGWSGRDLMVHLTAWQERVMDAARELAVADASATIERSSADWTERGAEVINAEITEAGRAFSLEEVRRRFASIPGEMRGYLTVVPETRWVKHPTRMDFILESTIDHYEVHAVELEAILAGAGAPDPSIG